MSNAISGLRYVIIFGGVYYITRFHPQWLKEDYRGWPLIAKTVATALVIAGLVLVGLSGSDGGAT